jgi:hypothetical protein
MNLITKVLLFSVTFLPIASSTLRTTIIQPQPNRFLFGVINDDGQHYQDEWGRGVRATTFELHWDQYEPQEGVYDQGYIDHMKQILAQLNAQGWFIQLVPGYQYVPDWVYANYSDMYYVNQYGEQYDPDPVTLGSYRVINAPFNPQARELIGNYLDRVFQDFQPDSFNSVRVGGGVQGELRYPPPDWMGHTNSYWAFDRYAQDPAISGIPANVIGWLPGVEPNPGSTGRGQLIVNPGFEQTHELLPIIGWTPEDEIQATSDNLAPNSGSLALKLVINTPHRIHQYVRVQPNTTYEFGSWLKTSNGSNQARVFFTQYNADNQIVASAPFGKLEANATSWNEQSGSLTTASSTRYLKVEMDGSQPGTYYFDDLWLKQAGESNTQSRDISIPLNFYDWYLKQLTNYQNWQITEIRKHYQGQLDLVCAGKGLMTGQLNDALTNDLNGDGWSEKSRALYSATAYEVHLNGLVATEGAEVYLTGIEDPPAGQVNDSSPYSGDWSAARWLAYLARDHGLRIWGENSGQNTGAEMDLALQRMFANGFGGLMWGFESELYAEPNTQGYATMGDYQAKIGQYTNLLRIFLPIIELGG